MKRKSVEFADKQEFLDIFKEELPPIIARSSVDKFFGGLFDRKTLANHDASGTGPKASYAVGKKIVYRREDLLQWVVDTFPIKRLQNLSDLGV